MLDNYVEQTKPLFKLLRTEAFRFVIVRYNHFSFVQELQKDVKKLFPNRPFQKVDARKSDYQEILAAYYALGHGFFFLENFDDVLQEQQDIFPQYEEANLRRRDITAGLNLRRDKLALYPIVLFVFVAATTDELFVLPMMAKMPDLWSFRSWILNLAKDVEVANTTTKTML